MQAWMSAEIERLVAEYGTVPPPWVVYNEHPYSICWRMGGGESHIMVWWEWWPQQGFTGDQKIAYLRRWPPPPCWLAFLIEAIWDVDTSEDEQLMPYFKRTSELGFGDQDDYQRDLNDPKWLERGT
jgi:hypothetical protein